MKISIRVSLDVDIKKFGDEYDEELPATEVRERIRADLVEVLHAAPYADSLKAVQVK